MPLSNMKVRFPQKTFHKISFTKNIDQFLNVIKECALILRWNFNYFENFSFQSIASLLRKKLINLKVLKTAKALNKTNENIQFYKKSM